MKATDGRDHLGDGHSLAVARFRRRLLGGLALEPGKGRWALDVGCGDGLEAVELVERGWKVRAVDLQPHPAWPALLKRHRGRLRFELADDAALARWKGSFSLVFQKDVLHHVPDPAKLMATLKRLTAPGGNLWVLECNRRNPVSYLHLTLMGGHQHFTRARLEALARGAGLAPWRLWRREARVWPVESGWFQDLVDRLQDGMEGLPFWRPFAVYHLLNWRKPLRRGQGSKA